jgi:hypothetical protein
MPAAIVNLTVIGLSLGTSIVGPGDHGVPPKVIFD